MIFIARVLVAESAGSLRSEFDVPVKFVLLAWLFFATWLFSSFLAQHTMHHVLN